MPLHAHSLTDRSHPYHTAPRNRWLLLNAPKSEPYPCMCQGTRPCKPPNPDGPGCQCWGRPDHNDMPANCCGRRAAAIAGAAT